jgi:hypothetical protein
MTRALTHKQFAILLDHRGYNAFHQLALLTESRMTGPCNWRKLSNRELGQTRPISGGRT